jgi:hypothetical protein
VTNAPATPRRTGFFKNLLYWLLDIDDPAFLDAGIQRMRNAPGFLASLSPEALEHIRRYDGPENHGPPLTRRERRALEQRLAAQRP